MLTNVGGADRVARIIIGLALIALGVTGVIGWWGLIGVVVLATGIVRVCPAYLPFRFSTRKKS
ncbi:YgaP family membrane protein [Saccharospirillum salsuginis]|uniref:Inner membrane protein YgaP-like transmembrane domain-containing protein n=1 Tax=Saccharospirillum salsuginis TaxID=418750 RepID=A0A918NFI3_9GAMM|nr:DUF2892 domain-containing protein [Saccharospirillum salsuginis]GGX69150.1 hypothetical protein GCM10007392_41080 [Saccharospirillum salsuginis]